MIRMLKNAASVDGVRPTDDLTKSFKRVFNAEAVEAAGKEMTYELSKLGSEGVIVSKGALSAIYHGDIITTTPGKVGCLSVFSFQSASPLQQNQSNHFTVIHLMNQNGKPMTLEQIQSSMKQSVLAPNNYHEMIDSAEIIGNVLSLHIGKDSKITVLWKAFVSKLK